MDDFLDYGVERLGGVLRVNSGTRESFKSIVKVMEKISELMKKRSKRVAGSFRKPCMSLLL